MLCVTDEQTPEGAAAGDAGKVADYLLNAPGDILVVTMLAPLRRRFEWWLDNNGFELVHVPDTPANTFVVVPTDARLAAYDLRDEPGDELRDRLLGGEL